MTQAATRQDQAAELDRRFYAFAIDRLLAWGVYAGAGYAAYRLLIEPGDRWAGIGAIAGVVVLVALGYAVPLGVAGVSPGKALVGLRVVRHDDGRPIGVPAALLRTVALGVAALPTFGLGVATLAWTAVMDPGGRRRGAHDRLTGALVVDIRPQPEPAEDADERPRQIVNLTAMRLMPVPQGAPVETSPPPPPATPPEPAPAPAHAPAPAPASAPPPAPPPPAPGRHAAPPPPPPVPAGAPTQPPPEARPVPDSPPPPAPGSPAHPVTTQRRADDTVGGATWRVTFDTGESFLVEGLALVGRRPEARGGEAVRHLVPLRSSDMSLSKTHAQFQVVPDGVLVVMDRGSTNGSVVIRKGVSKALTAGRPATLIDGDTVRFGDRSMKVTREA